MPDRAHWLARIKPLGARAEIPYRRCLTAAEADALRAGLWPRDMDDRWIVHLSGDAVSIHRSWTGHAIYLLPCAASADGTLLGPLFVSSDPATYRRQEDAKEIEMVESLIKQTVDATERPNQAMQRTAGRSSF